MLMDKEIQLFFQKCWSSEPSERPNFHDIYQIISKKIQFRNYLNANLIETVIYMQYIIGNNQSESSLLNAMRYHFGIGVNQNKEKAFELYKQSSDQFENGGSYYLSLFYEDEGNDEMSMKVMIKLWLILEIDIILDKVFLLIIQKLLNIIKWQQNLIIQKECITMV